MREKIFHLAVDSPDGHNGQSWEYVMPGTGVSTGSVCGILKNIFFFLRSNYFMMKTRSCGFIGL